MKKLILPIFAITLILSLIIFIGCDEESSIKPEVVDYEWKYLGLKELTVANLEYHNDKLFADCNQYLLSKNLRQSGIAWDTIFKPGANAIVGDFMVDIETGNLIVGVDGGANKKGVFKSSDGITWTPITNGLPEFSNSATAICQNPRNANEIFLSLRDAGLYKSENKGESWSYVSEKTLGCRVNNISFGGKNGDTIWAGGVNQFGPMTSFVVKSENRGLSWNYVVGLSLPVVVNYLNDVALDFKNSRVIYLGFEGGVIKTTNYGSSWNLLLSEFSNDDYGLFAVRIFINSENPNQIVIASRKYVFYSNNGGASVTKIDLPVAFSEYVRVESAAIDWRNRTVYVGILKNGVYSKRF